MENYNGMHSQGLSASFNDEIFVPTFEHQKSISVNWNSHEISILQDGLVKHACESGIFRYVKIATRLHGKTVRDVAMRCRWMTKKERSKRRNADIINTGRRYKNKKTSEAQFGI